jgi:DNA-binding CsgD family transcriptional regulator
MTLARVHGQLAAARGDWERAAGQFQSALQLGETMRMPVEVAKTHLAAGTGAAAAGHRRAAAHHLYSALDRFDSLGASGYSQRSVAMIDQAGLAMRRRDRTIGGGLTPTEAAVARLVAERLTNREVAARLFVTPKAVEYHLSNIYAKLGVHSRRALTDLPWRTTDNPD